MTTKCGRVGLALLIVAALVEPTIAQDHHDHAVPKVRTIPEWLVGEEARAVRLYEQVLPTVVTVFTRSWVLTEEGRQLSEGLGSGVLISPDCHVLTAAHVVAGAETIHVKTHDGKQYTAKLLFSESGADIALLRLLDPPPGLPHAKLGDSDRLAVGQSTYVIGSPLGLERSFTVGHVSGFREFDHLYDGTILAEFIQTDAAINSGNSGGPVFDSKGEVIGIASRILTRSGGFEGVGLVVAINTAKQLLALEDRTWLGIEAIFLSGEHLRRLFHLDRDGGLLVQRVTRDSPAEAAGLRGGTFPATIGDREVLLGGDLILELGGQEACHSECLVRGGKRISGLDRIPVTFLRAGEVRHVVVDVSSSRRNFLEPAPESPASGP